MKVSAKWLAEVLCLEWRDGFFEDTSLGKRWELSKIASDLTLRGLEVESIEYLAPFLKDVVVVRIERMMLHPDAQKLKLCFVQDGSMERQIVCGAQNMQVGDFVPCALPGAVLPQNVVIKKGVLRGQASDGMLCSAKELGVEGSFEDGLWILQRHFDIAGAGLIPGAPLAEVLGCHDQVLHFKLTPNRADALSILGIAREVVGLGCGRLQYPSAYRLDDPLEGLPLGDMSVFSLAEQTGCDQFLCAYIASVSVGPSPAWLVQKIRAMGGVSVNNVVDITNLVLWECAQPSHVYDASKLAPGPWSVRLAHDGETLKLLDGSTVELTNACLVVADAQKPLALAGVMGGEATKVTQSTTSLYLEVAQFDPMMVRKTASYAQKKTEAALRFEKGVDAASTRLAFRRLLGLLQEVASADGARVVVVLKDVNLWKSLEKRRFIPVDWMHITRWLGLRDAPLPKILEPLGCSYGIEGTREGVWVPGYRRDLQHWQDVAEEVMRVVGYDAVQSVLPPFEPLGLASLERETHSFYDRLVNNFCHQGFSEVIHFAFTSQAWLKKLGFSAWVPLLNPLSTESEVLVPSLLPSLLQETVQALANHFGDSMPAYRFATHRPTYHKDHNAEATATGVKEVWCIAGMMLGGLFESSLHPEQRSVDIRDMKAKLQNVLHQSGVKAYTLEALRSGEDIRLPVAALLHPGRSGYVMVKNRPVGVVGELHPHYVQILKIKWPVMIFEVQSQALAEVAQMHLGVFKPWGEFPSIVRDFAVWVPDTVTCDQVVQVVQKNAQPLGKSCAVFDVYQGDPVPSGMRSIAVRVQFYDMYKSLRDEDVEPLWDKIRKSCVATLQAQWRA